MNYPLRILFWEATSRCNAHCGFCGSKCNNKADINELNTHEICDALSKIAQKYDPKRIMINVTGGEPLLRSDLFTVMKYATDLGYSWGLVSNGFLINDEVIQNMKNSSMKTISISVDGLAETHDKIRGVTNGFDNIVNSIKKMHNENFIETIMITTVVSRRNIEELHSIKRFLCNLPINMWRVCPVDPIGRAEIDKELLLSHSQQKQLFDFISECRTENLPFEVLTSCSHYLGEYETKVREYPFRCYAGTNIASILSNGDIFVCPNVPRVPKLIQGNIRANDFVTVWETKFEYFRDPYRRHTGKCKDCDLFFDCKGDSLHTWDFYNDSPKFCIKDNENVCSVYHKDLSIIDTSEIIGTIKKEGRLFDNIVKGQSLSKDCVIIKPNATAELIDLFSWGIQDRSKEIIAALFGTVGCKKENRLSCVYIVDKIRLISGISADERHIYITQRLINKVSDLVYKTKKTSPDLEFIGFVHSHPNDLEIAMSYGDYKFHKTMFTHFNDLGVSIIVNPQKMQISAYSGLAANTIDLHLFSFFELTPKS